MNNIVKYLRTNLEYGETVDLKDIIFNLGITGNDVNTVKNSFKKTYLDKKTLGQTLKDMNIEVTSKRGKGGGTKITKN